MTITSEFNVHDHVWTFLDNKPTECIVKAIKFPTVVSTSNPSKGEDNKVIYHLVTKVDEDFRRNAGMASVHKDHEFTKHANEVAESAQTLLRRMLSEYELKML